MTDVSRSTGNAMREVYEKFHIPCDTKLNKLNIARNKFILCMVAHNFILTFFKGWSQEQEILKLQKMEMYCFMRCKYNIQLHL